MKTQKNWWDDKSTNGQAEYLNKHPKSKLNLRKLLDSEHLQMQCSSYEDFKNVKLGLLDSETKSITIKSSFFNLIDFISNKMDIRKEELTYSVILNKLEQLYNVSAEKLSSKSTEIEILLTKEDVKYNSLNNNFKLLLNDKSEQNINNVKADLFKLSRHENLKQLAINGMHVLSMYQAKKIGFDIVEKQINIILKGA